MTSRRRGSGDLESGDIPANNPSLERLQPWRIFLRFLLDAFLELDSIILMVVGVTSLGVTLKTEGIKQAWMDGVSLAMVIFVVVLSAVFSYRSPPPEKIYIRLKVHLNGIAAFFLTSSMTKLVFDGGKRLIVCKKMGFVTTICSDKTGTLTLNQMTVVECYAGGKKTDNQPLPAAITSLCVEGIAQNTTGSIYVPEGGGDLEFSGSPTEKAILGWGIKLGMNFDTARSQTSILHAFPFNSEKKRGGVAVKTADGEVHIHWKGASEIVLASCRSYIDEDGNVAPLTEDKALYFKNSIEEMAGRTLRCVALAFRTYEPDKVPTGEELSNWVLPEDDLILLAIVGIKDPCRPGVRDSVQLCQNAGIKVRMVTGDNVQTARAIALQAGILTSDADASEPNLIEGKSFRALTDAERDKISDKISVMGRSSPNDKLLLVQSLRRRGHVVAVIEDGTNDAPALHAADVGLATEIAGTEVAKESSDIVILDDIFASVVQSVRLGRSVYSNTRKLIQLKLTVNVTAVLINVVAAISSDQMPLTAFQLLWVNTTMDILGARALAIERPTDQLMGRPPFSRKEAVITNIILRNVLIQVIYQVSVLLVLNFRGINILGLQHQVPTHAIKLKNTLIFNAFIFCQVFNEFNARKPDEKNIFKGVIKNRFFMGVIVFTLVIQVIIVEFIMTKLNWKQWLICVSIGVISWPLDLVGKFIPVAKTPFSSKLSVLKCWGKRESSGVGQDHGEPHTSTDSGLDGGKEEEDVLVVLDPDSDPLPAPDVDEKDIVVVKERNFTDEKDTGGMTKETIVTWVKNKIDPGLYNLTTLEEAEKVLSSGNKVVLGYLNSLVGVEHDQLAAASNAEDDVNFYQTVNPDVAKMFHIDPESKRPAVVLVKREAEKISHFDGEFVKSALVSFVSANKLPLVSVFTRESAPEIFESAVKEQLLLFATTNDSEKVLVEFEEAAKSFKGKNDGDVKPASTESSKTVESTPKVETTETKGKPDSTTKSTESDSIDEL